MMKKRKKRPKVLFSSRNVEARFLGFRVKEWSLKVGWLDMTYCPSTVTKEWFSFTLGSSGLWIDLLAYPLLVVSPGAGWMFGIAGFTLYGGEYRESN